MVERWLPVEGFDGYEVSDAGRVRSLPRPRVRARIIATQLNNRGYLILKLYRNNTPFTFLLHRLVAAAFCANPTGLPEVNHKDGVKTNCRARNLEWCSRSYNKQHAVEHGLNTQAQRVRCPRTGREFPSITQAARASRCRHRTVAATFERV